MHISMRGIIITTDLAFMVSEYCTGKYWKYQLWEVFMLCHNNNNNNTLHKTVYH